MRIIGTLIILLVESGALVWNLGLEAIFLMVSGSQRLIRDRCVRCRDAVGRFRDDDGSLIRLHMAREDAFLGKNLPQFLQRAIRIPSERTSTNSPEPEPASLQHSLTSHILVIAVRPMPGVAVALNR